MDVCAAFSVPAASRALIFKTRKEDISGEVRRRMQAYLRGKKEKNLVDPW